MMSIFSTYVTNSAYKDRYGSLFITCIVVTGLELILMPKHLTGLKVILLVMH